jgi:hypothetical protein
VGNSGDGTGIAGSSAIGTGIVGTTAGNGQSGVIGQDLSSGGGTGVSGNSNHGTGVSGASTNGTGVQAASSAGTALAVAGKVTFSSSGTATVAPGQTSVTVSLAGVTPSSIVLATLQQVQSRVTLAAAVPGTGSLTINLTRKAAASLPVAWFVIG